MSSNPFVGDRDLRQRAESEATSGLETKNQRCNCRYDVHAERMPEWTFAIEVRENRIGCCNQSPRECHALRFVAVECIVCPSVAQPRVQLPSQVYGVIDAGVQALTSDGTMQMRRIAEQKDARNCGGSRASTLSRRSEPSQERPVPATRHALRCSRAD